MTDIISVLNSVNFNLKFTANAIVEGFISGLHKSPYHGFSVEFSDHKPYSRGDTIGLIDWKLYSKTDKYYTKRYEEETNVRTYFLLDCSNSMNFQSQEIKKINYAKLLTASLMNLSLKQRDATGLILFNDKILLTTPAKSKSNWLNQCLKALESIVCIGSTNISKIVLTVGEKIKKRSLIVIITDFLDDPEKLQKALNYLKFNKHHCILLHIIDKEENDFTFRDETNFIDLESNEKLTISPWLIKKNYLDRFNMFHMKLKTMTEKMNFEYRQIHTNTHISESLKLFLLNRK
jgi:uncharacterized protein (DUF58 family)